ncbi:hypothetical protein XH79_06965, partial [Bradyrhizobium sp. CCBAU 45389]|nr:hypothetical protein [Bradyrhizobium sp. CCBAU 45389]
MADELRYAPEGNLKGYARSDEAIALVRLLAQTNPRVPQVATETSRTNKPRKLEPNFHRAIGAFLASLLLARTDEEAGGWLRMSLDKKKFKSPAPVSYRMFMALRSAWLNARLIEQHKGYPGSLKFGSPGPANGMMTRFRATVALLKLCERHGVQPADVSQHFHLEFEMPQEVLQLTRPSRPTPDTPASRQLRDQVNELNAFFAKHSLEGATHIGWVRKFHRADSLPYAWNKGGRLYSQPPLPATNYQQMKQGERLALRLNGQPVAEIDISASYLTLFYAWHEQEIDAATAYSNIIGPDEKHRAIVKIWINNSFGNSGLLTKWSPGIKADFARRYRDRGWTIDARLFPVRLVREKTLERHPLLAQWGKPNAGRPQSYADLMFRESEIIISTMLRLAREHGIPA